MLENRWSIKKVVGAACVGAILLIAASVAYQYLSTGQLTVTTDVATDYVSITPIKQAVREDDSAKNAQKKLSMRVKPGTYELSAFNKSFSTTKVITIKARQSLSFVLSQTKDLVPEPVYGSSGSSFIADSSQILFLNTNNNLASIDANDKLTVLFPNNTLYGAKWASTSLGIVRDENNKLYAISDGQLNLLRLPFSVDKQSILNYDISKTGKLYLSKDKIIYAGDTAGNFKKLYSSDKTITSLAAGVGSVAAITSSANSQDNAGPIVVVSDSGKVLGTDLDSNALAWSDDGKHLLAQGESGVVLLDANLKKTVVLPSKNTDVFAWGTSNIVFYSRGGVLWSFDLSSGQSQQVALMPGQNLIDGVYPSQDGAYVYVSAQKIDALSGGPARSQLFRVGIKGQVVDNSLSSLSVFLPEPIGYCSVNYINFTHPTILIGYPSASLQQNCQSLTTTELQNYNLNVNKFQFNFILLSD